MYRRTKKIVMICLAVGLAVVSALIYYFYNIAIPNEVEKAVMKVRKEIDLKYMDKTKIAVVTSADGIKQNTKLTEEVIQKNITFKDIPNVYAIENPITTREDLLNKITKVNLVKGQQITKEYIAKAQDWIEDDKRLKEYYVSSIVADEVKEGNLVDILVIYERLDPFTKKLIPTGEYDVVVSKIKVEKIIKDTKSYKVTDLNEDIKDKRFIIVIAVNEKQYRNLEYAKALGKLETRLYIDESQEPSPVTFSIEKAQRILNLNNINSNLTPFQVISPKK